MQAQAPQQDADVKLTEMKGLQQKAYVYRSMEMGDLTQENGHLNGFTPFYLVYPDKKSGRGAGNGFNKRAGY